MKFSHSLRAIGTAVLAGLAVLAADQTLTAEARSIASVAVAALAALLVPQGGEG
jgi:hypothetical protein